VVTSSKQIWPNTVALQLLKDLPADWISNREISAEAVLKAGKAANEHGSFEPVFPWLLAREEYVKSEIEREVTVLRKVFHDSELEKARRVADDDFAPVPPWFVGVEAYEKLDAARGLKLAKSWTFFFFKEASHCYELEDES
jgi:hypothetical protein